MDHYGHFPAVPQATQASQLSTWQIYIKPESPDSSPRIEQYSGTYEKQYGTNLQPYYGQMASVPEDDEIDPSYQTYAADDNFISDLNKMNEDHMIFHLSSPEPEMEMLFENLSSIPANAPHHPDEQHPRGTNTNANSYTTTTQG
jgi:hypothetical protein